MLSIKVSDLLHKPQGAKKPFVFDEAVDFEESDHFYLSTPIKANGQLLKLPHEINVQIHDLRATTSCVCSRCLRSFQYEIVVPLAEREFIIDLPPTYLEKGEEIFYIGKDNAIHLYDMVREELLLHFPPIPLCSESCQGLCNQCGTNLNEKKCSCKAGSKATVSPFKFIKTSTS